MQKIIPLRAAAALVSLFLGPLLSAQTPVYAPGVTLRLYDVQEPMDRLYDLVPNQTPNIDILRPNFTSPHDEFTDPTSGSPFSVSFIVHLFGQINAVTAGTYEFRLTSDDGSLLYFASELVIDNDGAHGPESVEGSLTLTEGWHDLSVKAFNDVGDFTLTLEWKPPGASDFVDVPESALRADDNTVRVVSPGKKYILNNGDLIPGTGLPLEGVHPAWNLETIRPEGFEPQVGAMALQGNSTLYLGTFQPNQQEDPDFDADAKVWRVDNVDGELSNITATQVAGSGLPDTTQLNDITGLEWFDDELFLAERTGIFRMIDDNGDGLFESKELIGDSWSWDNFHQFPFCLKHRSEVDGEYLYGALSVAISLGGNSDSNRDAFRGSVFRLKIPPRGEQNSVEYLAGGFRTPNGVGFGPGGELLVTDNQGGWNPANSLVSVEAGRFYGHFNPTDVYPPPADFTAVAGQFEEQPVTPKTVYMPQNEVSNSPSDIVTLESGPYAGQLLVGELTAGGLRRVSLEKIEGEMQGAVFRHSQGFEAGVNRLRQSADGSIYVGCMGSNGSWSYQNLVQGLQRLRANDSAPSVFEIKDVRALSDGLEVEFTEPVPLPLLENPDSYFIEQWHYEATEQYGGPKLGLEQLSISAITSSDDRMTVRLTLPEISAGKVIYLRTGVRNDDSESLWTGEAWYSMNRLPASDAPLGAGPWENLFNGNDLTGWRAYQGEALPDRWTVQDGALTIDPSLPGEVTDIITEEVYGDFELELEWKVGPDQNSGIFVRLQEQGNAIWEGGPEMQIVDDTLNDDGFADLTRAGSIYNLYPFASGTYSGSDQWQQVHILANGPNLTYYLNGTLVASYDIESEDYWDRVQNSNFNYITDFGRLPSGHIGFQDYNNFVQFRNIRLRELNVAIDPDDGESPTVESIRIELENGILGDGASVSTEDPGYSGDGFVAGWDNYGSHETLTVDYEAPIAGDYQLQFQYGRALYSGVGTLDTDGEVQLLLDGNLLTTLPLTTTEYWNEWQLTAPYTVSLAAGSHSITLRNPYSSEEEKKLGVANFDFLEIIPPSTTSAEVPDISDFSFALGPLDSSADFTAALDGQTLFLRVQTVAGLSYVLETSPDLVTWTSALTIEGDGSVLTASSYFDEQPRGFVRLKVSATQ